MEARSLSKNKYVILLALFICLIIIFQFLSGIIKIGPISLSLVLVPIAIGAQLFGKKFGTILGFSFGVITMINSINGSDAGGYILFNANPFLLILLCLVKATLAGFITGLVFELLSKKCNSSISSIISAICCPIVNTLTFCACMFLFFKDILVQWADGSDIFVYVIVSLVGLNFIVEFAINLIVVPFIYHTVSKSNKLSRLYK